MEPISAAAVAAFRASMPVPSRSLLRFMRHQTGVAPQYRDAPRGRPPLSFCSGGPTGEQRSCRRLYMTTSGAPRKKTTTLCKIQNTPSHAASTMTPVGVSSGYAKKRQAAVPRRRFGTTAVVCKVSEPDESKAAHATSWQERLWGSMAKKGSKPLHHGDLPSTDNLGANSSFVFQNRRNLAAKAALDPRLRCTEVDENGKVILVDGEFKKTELIAKYGLLPRDLRKIDSSNLPHILVRDSAILLNLLHLRVLIKHDRVLLFDVYGSRTSYSQSAFMYDLQGKLQQKSSSLSSGLPYEFRALETVLTSVTSELEADFDAVREPVMHILSELEDDIDRQKLRVLLILSKRVSTFKHKAKLVRDAIDELLDDDDDLSAMYLTEKSQGEERGLNDHTEVEMLLESYHKLTDEIVQEADNLVSGIRNTEEIVRAILDANRNALMLLDLKFSVGTLGLAMGTFLAGLYGMNLENFIEETNWGFGAVTSVSTVFSLFVCWYGLVKLRKVQRIKMGSNEVPHLGGRGGQKFHGEDDPLGLLDSRNRERLRRMNLQKLTAEPKRRRWWMFGFR